MNMNIPPPSIQQSNVLDLWKNKQNVSVSAVAGAGKSTLIMTLCEHSEEPVCIVTYNKTLQEELDQKLIARGSQCVAFTFHGLATEYFRLCRDDSCLANLNEYGSPTKPFLFKNVIIDEAQDMKKVYFDLVLKLTVDPTTIHWALVGDPEQMLYDYDPDDPAVLNYLVESSESFNVPFHKATLSKSFRLTPNVAQFSNSLSSDNSIKIEPGNTKFPNEKVDVQVSERNKWAAIAIQWLLHVHPVEKPGIIHILSARRKGNKVLKQLVNQLTVYGYSVYVHIDDHVSNKKNTKVHVMSWHSSKGGECDTAIILGMEYGAQLNPLHVAVTRTRHRMLVLANYEDIFIPFALCILNMPEFLNILDKDRTIDFCTCAVAVHNDNIRNNEKKKTEEEDISMTERERKPQLNPNKKTILDKTNWEPIGREYRLHGFISKLNEYAVIKPQSIADTEQVVATGYVADISEHYLTYAKIRNEYKNTRTVRMHEFASSPLPTQKKNKEYLETIANVPSSGTYENDLLPSFAMNHLKSKCSDLSNIGSVERWVTLSVILNAWEGFHNKTHMHLPVADWLDIEVAIDAERVLYNTMPIGVTDYHNYAMYKRTPTLTYKARYFARHNGTIYQCVYEDEISYQTLARLSLPAIYNNDKLQICNIKTGTVYVYEFPQSIDKTLSAMNM